MLTLEKAESQAKMMESLQNNKYEWKHVAMMFPAIFKDVRCGMWKLTTAVRTERKAVHIFIKGGGV